MGHLSLYKFESTPLYKPTYLTKINDPWASVDMVLPVIVIQTKFHLIILKLKMPNQFIHKIVVFPMHDFIASCKQRYKNFDG